MVWYISMSCVGPGLPMPMLMPMLAMSGRSGGSLASDWGLYDVVARLAASVCVGEWVVRLERRPHSPGGPGAMLVRLLMGVEMRREKDELGV